MNWIVLKDTSQLDALIKESFNSPCILYKHSSRCSLSTIVKMRLENSEQIPGSILKYLLPVIEFRNLSNKVSDIFDVYHESPQMLLIQNGECILESSHLDIHADEIADHLSSISTR